jgi:hypothetical protein
MTKTAKQIGNGIDKEVDCIVEPGDEFIWNGRIYVVETYDLKRVSYDVETIVIFRDKYRERGSEEMSESDMEDKIISGDVGLRRRDRNL